MRRTIAALLAAASLVASPLAEAPAGLWAAAPITVHEWGVHDYNWATGRPGKEPLPRFIYTDKRPGVRLPAPKLRVKDMPPDSGIRLKPVLYFYPPDGSRPVSVGVEVRFANGHANAWWPQVNVYRTPDQVAKAKPVDWAAWRKKFSRWRRNVKVPDDERFELAWHALTLTRDVPAASMLAGKGLPADHWVKIARQVDAWYVSNGKQAERYLFYEGATRKTPRVAILPPEHREKHYHVVNVGDEPIYDVFVIYRDRARARLWTDYLAVMPPVPQAKRTGHRWGHDVPQVMSLPLPDFDGLPPGDQVNDREFRRRTTERLITALTAGEHRTPRWYPGLRDPADPQPPTKMHMLFKKEAVALERIWRKDFFDADGLTIIYRESPGALDRAMPLHIRTDMHHFVKLSRCGLVLNRNVPYKDAKAVRSAVRHAASHTSAAKRREYLETCRKSRLMALGLARFELRQPGPVGGPRLKQLIAALEGREPAASPKLPRRNAD